MIVTKVYFYTRRIELFDEVDCESSRLLLFSALSTSIYFCSSSTLFALLLEEKKNFLLLLLRNFEIKN